MKRLLCVACFILFVLVGCTAVSSEPAVEPANESAVAATNAPTTEPTVEVVTSEPTVEPIEATPTPTVSPEPTEAPQLPEPPVREEVDNLTAVSAHAISYVQNEQLFIRTLPDGQTVPVHTEPCPEDSYCSLDYLKWSPDGQFLLYFYYDGGNSSLRVSDRQGDVQIIEDVGIFRPGDWSSDGRTIAYIQETETYFEADDTSPGGRLMEVWTVSLAEEGILGAPQLAGTWRQLGDGCGGGGRSISEVLYEDEGGTAYGYKMGVTEWSAPNILLYNLDCTNIGIGRFDMASGTELPSFDQPLRNLVLNNSGDRWYAVTGNAWDRENPENNQLVTGTPDSTEITVIPTSAKVELVFVGQISGALYYTERNPLGRESYDDRGLYFAYYESALWRIQPDGSGEERLLFGEDDHAYAQVAETARPEPAEGAVGDLLFVLVENERPLAEAAQFVEGNPDTLQAYYPQRHIMQLPANGGEPTTILNNAGQPALTLP